MLNSEKWVQRGLSSLALLAFCLLYGRPSWKGHLVTFIAVAFSYAYGRFDKGKGY